MSDTPFISSLTKEKRDYVAKYAKIPRPTYFSAAIKDIADSVEGEVDLTNPELNPEKVISKDFEAMLILSSKEDKSNLIAILNFLVTKRQPSAELDLMDEVLGTRAESYKQVVEDLKSTSAGSLVSSIEKVRGSLFNLLINTPITNDDGTKKELALGDEPIAVLIPDMSNMFNVINDSTSELTKPEILSVHDRIVDQLTVSYYTGAGLRRQEELFSWIRVIQTYLTM